MSEAPELRLRKLDYSALQQCMHCGMCLPTCPTYDTTRNERNSPRGRIALMRAIADRELEPTSAFAEEMYYCLGCLACSSACPADVNYPLMFEAARADIEDLKLLHTKTRSMWRTALIKGVFMRPRLLRALGRALRLYQRTGGQRLFRALRLNRLLPKSLRDLEPMAPAMAKRFSDQVIAPRERPRDGAVHYRVGMLTGCVQDLVFSDINRDTVDVLLANGCEVVTPRHQSCCGSLHAHNGELEYAKILARRAIDGFDLDEIDVIISNAGGCGSHLKHYGALLSDDPKYIDRARAWDLKLKDIHEWLDSIDLSPPGPLPQAIEATYHASCHLHHGQRVKTAPERLLRKIPNLTLNPLAEADWCCGSAGIYNITQPEEAMRLQRRKVDNIRNVSCSVVATANPGCHLQLQNGLGGEKMVMHPISLLAAAYRHSCQDGSATSSR